MDAHQHVNSILCAGDQHALSKLFDIGDGSMLGCIQAINPSLVAPPFDMLLSAYKSFVESPTFENSLSVLRGSSTVLDSTRAVKQIIKNSIWSMTLSTESKASFLDEDVRPQPRSGELAVAFKNILLSLFRASADKNVGLSVYISNILCMVYLESDDYRSVTDLVALSKPTCKNNDYYVFMFYKGLIGLYNERLREGYGCISTAFRSKKLRRHIFPVVFAVSSLTLGTGQAEGRWHSRKRTVSGDRAEGGTVRYPPSFLSLDVFSAYLEANARGGSDLYFTADDLRLLIKSREIVANGFIDILDSSMPVKFYTEVHLIRLMKVFQPLFCFRNLIYRFYVASNCPARLSISDVLRFTSKEKAEVYCIILGCIYRGLIRGYLSADREVIVLSRVMPFPDVLNTPGPGANAGPVASAS